MDNMNLADLTQLIDSYSPPSDDANMHIYNMNFIAALQGKVLRLKHVESRKVHFCHNKRWRVEVEISLMRMYGEGSSLAEMSRRLGRARRPIQFHVSKMLIDESRRLTYEGLAAKYKKTANQIQQDIDTLHI